MAEAETKEKQVKPILPFLRVPENPDEKPYLAGSKCKSCGATYLGARMACHNAPLYS